MVKADGVIEFTTEFIGDVSEFDELVRCCMLVYYRQGAGKMEIYSTSHIWKNITKYACIPTNKNYLGSRLLFPHLQIGFIPFFLRSPPHNVWLTSYLSPQLNHTEFSQLFLLSSSFLTFNYVAQVFGNPSALMPSTSLLFTPSLIKPKIKTRKTLLILFLWRLSICYKSLVPPQTENLY